ncbi:MAG: GntR family transcriptional regulator [Gemmatimonadetes bacterium]|nr:GntR family transcriptional regulator [Gemmatimonadota bacterium]
MAAFQSRVGRAAVGRAGPLYLGLADFLAQQVGAGAPAGGQRLPAQRELGRRLGMDVTTISRAMREAQQRGLVVTRGRAGSFVAP